MPRTQRPSIVCLVAAVLTAGCAPSAGLSSEQKGPNVTESQPSGPAAKTEVATFGGGCFWCIEAVFQELKGVTSVESGYSGGWVANPTYQQVCTGKTGHAEVCQIHFDPAKISYAELLKVFFKVHDPTTLNRQGPDFGTQYRSVIFYHNDAQKKLAEEVKQKLDAAAAWDSPIVTEIVPFEKFYRAEDYHQDYFRRHPGQGYCRTVIRPKMLKFRKAFEDMRKEN